VTTDDSNQGVGEDEALAWRDQVSLRILRGSFLIFIGGGVLVLHGVTAPHSRLALAGLALVAAVVVGVPALTRRPAGSARAWLAVVPGVLISIGGYATVGTLSGPGVCLTVSLMLAGLLLGRRAMIGLTIAAAAVLAAVGFAMVHGELPAPAPADISMTNPVAWFRTLTVTFLAVGLFGSLMLAVIIRIEASLTLARSETQRRESADRARVEAERVALEAKQLETVGRLAAGVAHDFNNNLTSIMGCAELLIEDLASRPESRELAESILQASQRAAELTRQLLAYSRKAQMLLVPLDLHHLITSAVSLLRRSIDPSVKVVTVLEAQNASVAADRALLESALLNLLLNGRDAMPDGGVLRIHTHSVELPAGETPAGPSVLIEVEDSGRGIDPALLPQIFDPFFTTKAVGRGTGLGLAAVSGTIKSHGGRIEVASTLGRGTTFRVYLPLSDEPGAESGPTDEEVVRGSGEILLVEDDAMVSLTAVTTLKSLGYAVTHASDGKAAVELVHAAPSRFALVLLDLRMPGMSGEATFRAVHNLNPKLPVLIWSGYAAEQDVKTMLERGAAGFLAKPYRIAELSQAIARALHV
jgi:signal transduction histidine kinase/CheY-like chemotaxis protein